MLLYAWIIIYPFYIFEIWNLNHLKDTVVWFLGSATVMSFKVIKIEKNTEYFKKLALENLKLLVIIEFIIGFYSFSLITELVTIPLIGFLVMLSAVAGLKTEHKPVQKIIDFILSVYGVFIISVTIFQAIINFNEFATSGNLISFLLPMVLTFLFIPFIYLFGVYALYDDCSVWIEMFFKDNRYLAFHAKWKSFFLCLFNLDKAKEFSKVAFRELSTSSTKKDIDDLVKSFHYNKISN